MNTVLSGKFLPVTYEGVSYPYQVIILIISPAKSQQIEEWLHAAIGHGYTKMTSPHPEAKWCWNKSHGSLKFLNKEDRSLFLLTQG